MVDTNRLLGGRTPLDTSGPFRFDRQPGNSFLGLLEGALTGVETAAKLEGISRLRADRDMQKLNMRSLEMELEKDRISMEVVKNGAEVHPVTGDFTFNRSKIINGFVQAGLVDRAVKVKQAFVKMDHDANLAEQQRLKAEREALKAPLERRKLEAEIGAIGPKAEREARRLEIAEESLQLRERTAETPAQKLERSRQLGVAAAEVEKSAKPLTGEAAKSVAQLDTLLEMTDDVETLFDPKFVGRITGSIGGAAREFTGEIADQEVEFRRVTRDIKDMLLRARSGAQINEQEFKRLSDLTPSPSQPEKVFKARLRGFRRAVQQLRDNRVRISTTGRGALRPGTGAALESEIRPPTTQEPLVIQSITPIDQ